jgi:hypothetical protein
LNTRTLQKIEKYRQANIACAEIILADAERYGGLESAICQWARLVIDAACEATEPASRSAA